MPGYTTDIEVSADTPIVTTAETVIATLTGCSNSGPGKPIRLSGQAKITTGTATTQLTFRIRRDSLTGTLVTDADFVTIEAAAGGTEDHDLDGVDSLTTEVFNQTYVLTVQQTAATANGSSIYAYLKAQCE